MLNFRGPLIEGKMKAKRSKIKAAKAFKEQAEYDAELNRFSKNLALSNIKAFIVGRYTDANS